MLQTIALLVVLAGAAWLGLVGAICALRPERARQGLAQMGANWRMQLGEHIPRAIVGAAMVVRTPASKVPALFEIGGWFILASSIIILLLPMRWHHAYAVWWAERIPLSAYRVLAVPTFAGASALAFAAL